MIRGGLRLGYQHAPAAGRPAAPMQKQQHPRRVLAYTAAAQCRMAEVCLRLATSPHPPSARSPRDRPNQRSLQSGIKHVLVAELFNTV